MDKLKDIAAFTLNNMPMTNPKLTDEDALDVAAFIINQPRPHFAAKKK
jgi:thiosulfate dehydrogenase